MIVFVGIYKIYTTKKEKWQFLLFARKVKEKAIYGWNIKESDIYPPKIKIIGYLHSP